MTPEDVREELEDVIADALTASLKSGKSDRTLRDIEHIADALEARPDLLRRLLDANEMSDHDRAELERQAREYGR